MSAPYRITVYRDKRGEWRWRASRKGRVIFAASEGYKRLGGCMQSLLALMRDATRPGAFALSYDSHKTRAAAALYTVRTAPRPRREPIHVVLPP